MMKVLFLHGIGDTPTPTSEWLVPLNERLEGLNLEPIGESDVFAPDYQDFLKGIGVPDRIDSPHLTGWSHARSPASNSYFDEQSLRLSKIPGARDRYGSAASAGARAATSLGRVTAWRNLDQVVNYMAPDGRVRRQVRAWLVQQVRNWQPQDPILVIGHSLGSVVALDIIRRFPMDVVVQGLITVGSPLAQVPELRSELADYTSEAKFPTELIRGWANVYDERDPVTGGGIHLSFSPAVDIRVDTGARDAFRPGHDHSLRAYCGSNGLASAIGVLADQSTDDPVGLPLGNQYVPLLLEFAYSGALGGVLSGERRRSFDLARLQAAESVSKRSDGVVPRDVLVRARPKWVEGSVPVEALIALVVAIWQYEPIAGAHLERDRDSKRRVTALRNCLEDLGLDTPRTGVLVSSIQEATKFAHKRFHPPYMPSELLRGPRLFKRSDPRFTRPAPIPMVLLSGSQEEPVQLVPDRIDDRASLVAALAGPLDQHGRERQERSRIDEEAEFGWKVVRGLCVEGYPEEARQLMQGLLAVIRTRRLLESQTNPRIPAGSVAPIMNACKDSADALSLRKRREQDKDARRDIGVGLNGLDVLAKGIEAARKASN